MTQNLLDFSQRLELALHAQVIADVQLATAAQNAPVMVVGAFARDLLVHYAYDIPAHRQTEDVDFAIAVADWSVYADLKKRLQENGQFREATKSQHRLHHVSGLLVDLVPFDGVETISRHLDWPPGGEFRMDVFGFREAVKAALPVRLPDDVDVLVVSPPALVVLKLIAWQDRHYQAPKKDALDLMLIGSNYLDLGNQNRLWDEFMGWTEEENFDTRRAGARMLGVDIAAMLDDAGRDRLASILAVQADEKSPGLLPQEMHPENVDLARMLLQEMLLGLTGEKTK